MENLLDIVWLLGQIASVAALVAGAVLTLLKTEPFPTTSHTQSGAHPVEVDHTVERLRKAA